MDADVVIDKVQPVRSAWSGLKLASKQLLPVTTFRGSQCGLLQSYAG